MLPSNSCAAGARSDEIASGVRKQFDAVALHVPQALERLGEENLEGLITGSYLDFFHS